MPNPNVAPVVRLHCFTIKYSPLWIKRMIISQMDVRPTNKKGMVEHSHVTVTAIQLLKSEATFAARPDLLRKDETR